MEACYIDTSFLAPYYLPEASSAAVERKLRSLPEGSLIISPLVRTEFASVLSRKVRAQELDETDARRAMNALERHLNMRSLRMVDIIGRDFARATEWIMTMKYSLRAPDALHLAVAVRQDAILWTLDRSLSSAAKQVGLESRN